MVRFSIVWRGVLATVAVTSACLLCSCATAQDALRARNDGLRPSYQRHRFDSHHGGAHEKFRRNDFYFQAPAVESGWFQRPYPYHLDYYRMRYGGSYAPYFGNLYGPPQVVTAPPYFGPYYGGFDYGSPYGFNAPVPFGGNGFAVPPQEAVIDAAAPFEDSPRAATGRSEPEAVD